MKNQQDKTDEIEDDENNEKEILSEEKEKSLTDVATKLWDLANRITAFAVLQMLVTLFLLAREDLFAKVLQINAIMAMTFTALMGCGYAFAVYKCYESEIKIRKRAKHPKVCMDTAWLATKGRLISIGIFTILGFIIMLENYLKLHERLMH